MVPVPVEAEGKILCSCGEVSYTDGALMPGADSFCVLR
jgi:hypothetical protein